jgi:hypothetical protein
MASSKAPLRRPDRAVLSLPNRSLLGEGQVSRPRVAAEYLLQDIAMPRRVREIIADRLEVILIEAMARGRRLARVSMRSRRRHRR